MSKHDSLEERLDKLAKIPLFSSFADNKESLKKVNDICSLKEVEADTIVLAEGSKGDDMFIVFDGTVEVRKRTRSGDEYTVVELKAEYQSFLEKLLLFLRVRGLQQLLQNQSVNFL